MSIVACMGIVLMGSSQQLYFNFHPIGLDLPYYENSIATFVPENWKLTTVMLFAFLQSVHYLVWIRLIPEEDRRQSNPRGFRKSFDALDIDFGFVFLLATAVLFVSLIGYGFFAPEQARNEYLTLISFHGFLELFVLAYQQPRRLHDMDRSI